MCQFKPYVYGGLARFAIVAIVLCAACDRSDPRPVDPPVAAPVDSSPALTHETPLEMAERHFSQVPDSVLMRRGACPFECCVYGEWRAVSGIPVLTDPRRAADTAYVLQPRDRFTADDGHVQILGPAIVVVMDTVKPRPDVRFVPGDTLVVLDYIGEGHWNLWHRGRVIEEVAGFWGAEVQNPAGAYYGDYAKEWWVHVKSPRAGWFRADTTYRYSGADACGVPEE